MKTQSRGTKKFVSNLLSEPQAKPELPLRSEQKQSRTKSAFPVEFMSLGTQWGHKGTGGEFSFVIALLHQDQFSNAECLHGQMHL